MTGQVDDVVRELRERLAALHPPTASVPSAAERADTAQRESALTDTALTDTAQSESALADTAPTENAHTGAVLSEAERAEETQARNICLRLLADSARPRAGLAQKLTQRGISDPVIERVLDRFTEVGLIDDQAYAHAYVRSKHQERSLSRWALASELRRKGLDDDVVDRAADAVDPAAEEIAAIRLITKRAPAALAAGAEAGRRRLLALLDRRGYPAELSIRVVDSVLAGQDE